ncbi:MAG: zinc-binding dehydrogenase [Bacteroidota bacterium]
MPHSLPQDMLTVSQPGPGEVLGTQRVPLPKPGRGEVLIRMAASPINPSDLAFLAGNYGVKKAYPVVPGFEGSGTVVAAGAGILPRLWLGRRVACASDNRGLGTWAEYMVTTATRCVPLQSSVTDEQGAMMLVNPLTALAFFDQLKQKGVKGVIANAGASALGRMIIRLGRARGVAVISVVRKAAQIEELQALGATATLDSRAADFLSQLSALSQQHQARILLDAVAGPLTAEIMAAMPTGAEAWVYGNLSGQEIPLPSSRLIFEGKRVQGFWLSQVLANKPFWKAFLDTRRVQALVSSALETQVQGRFPLEEAQAAVALYTSNMSGGKALMVPR